MKPISYKRHRFPPDTIRLAVWLYFRFTTSLRDVEEMLAERGIDVTYETVRYRDIQRSASPDSAMLALRLSASAHRLVVTNVNVAADSIEGRCPSVHLIPADRITDIASRAASRQGCTNFLKTRDAQCHCFMTKAS